MSSIAKFITKGELESLFFFLADCLGCHCGGWPDREGVVSAWKKTRAGFVDSHLKCFPDDKREDVESDKEFFGDCVKTLEKIQRAHEEPDGLTFIYTIDTTTVRRMRETAKVLNIPFRTFLRIHADISFVFKCAAEDHGLTFGHYVWPSREAAQKAIDGLSRKFRERYERETDFAEGGEWRREKLVSTEGVK